MQDFFPFTQLRPDWSRKLALPQPIRFTTKNSSDMVTRVFLHFMWFALSSHQLSMVKTFAPIGCCCFGSFESQLKVAPLSSKIFNNLT